MTRLDIFHPHFTLLYVTIECIEPQGTFEHGGQLGVVDIWAGWTIGHVG